MKALPEIERRPLSKELVLLKKVNDAKEFAKKIDWEQLNSVMNTNYPIPKR
jgi:hypothetical protein